MTEERLNLAGNLAKIITALLGIVTVALGSGFFWTQVWHIPNLVYTILPSYEVGGQVFGGIVVENRGRASAHNVLFKLSDLNQPIQALKVKSDDVIALREGGEGTPGLIMWSDRVTPGSTTTVYFLSREALSFDDHLTVSFEEGAAIPGSGENPASGRAALTLVGFFGALALTAVISVTYLVNQLKRQQREREAEFRRKLAEMEADLRRKERESEIDLTTEARTKAVQMNQFIIPQMMQICSEILGQTKEAGFDQESTREYLRLAFGLFGNLK